jgi:hypothetical protein
MCKGSIRARNSAPAETGVRYLIGETEHHLGVFHPVGQRPRNSIICVEHGAILTLSNIPRALRRKHQIGREATVTFDATGDDLHDMIVLDSGKRIPLADFANQDVHVVVGAEDVPSEASAAEPALVD